MKTLLLFDLDGTLVTTRAGRVAFNRAFEQVFGLREAAGTVTMAGRTDPAIFRELCEQHGLDPATFGAWKLTFLAELADALREDPGFTHPGVVELLEEVHGDDRFVLALGTGNVEEGARLKLAPHDLNRYFATGGFGSDGENRNDVIARGIERAQAMAGKAFAHLVVIGDTPFDIACGQANGCHTIGVATGPHSAEELKESGADLVMSDFGHPDHVLRWIKALSSR